MCHLSRDLFLHPLPFSPTKTPPGDWSDPVVSAVFSGETPKPRDAFEPPLGQRVKVKQLVVACTKHRPFILCGVISRVSSTIEMVSFLRHTRTERGEKELQAFCMLHSSDSAAL